MCSLISRYVGWLRIGGNAQAARRSRAPRLRPSPVCPRPHSSWSFQLSSRSGGTIPFKQVHSLLTMSWRRTRRQTTNRLPSMHKLSFMSSSRKTLVTFKLISKINHIPLDFIRLLTKAGRRMRKDSSGSTKSVCPTIVKNWRHLTANVNVPVQESTFNKDVYFTPKKTRLSLTTAFHCRTNGQFSLLNHSTCLSLGS